jgi:small-conductance mechanosensitive channel
MRLSFTAITFLGLGASFLVLTVTLLLLTPSIPREAFVTLPILTSISSFMAVFLIITGLALIFEHAHVKTVKISLRNVLKVLLIVVMVIAVFIAFWNILRIVL